MGLRRRRTTACASNAETAGVMADNTVQIIVVALVLATGITIPVLISWFDHRTRTRALEVLRVYAERGEEPPVSVTQALTWVSGWPKTSTTTGDGQ